MDVKRNLKPLSLAFMQQSDKSGETEYQNSETNPLYERHKKVEAKRATENLWWKIKRSNWRTSS